MYFTWTTCDYVVQVKHYQYINPLGKQLATSIRDAKINMAASKQKLVP